MPPALAQLSFLGIIHTAISLLAILSAITAFVERGKITLESPSGAAYVCLTVLTCLTSLPIMRTGHLTPAHYLAVIILVLLAVGVFADKIPGLKKAADYIEIIMFSTTLFLSMIPAVTETLTRLPVEHPISSGPNDPKVQLGILIFAVIYLFGVTYQLLKLRKTKKRLGTTTLV